MQQSDFEGLDIKENLFGLPPSLSVEALEILGFFASSNEIRGDDVHSRNLDAELAP